ncbi:flagellin [Roseomonas sp. CCTCC AB2023176]|uniref:flagellin n=1 Tax=Roseomonas sp. CCTCC AB2023176 TaxID=3342640 RepID=UPI0035DAD771
MSGVAGVAPGALTRLIADSSGLKARLATLSAQAADGRRGDLYGDIGTGASRAISLRGEVARREAQSAALDRALARTGAGQDAMRRLSTIAENFFAEAQKVTTADPARIGVVAADARSALKEVAGLLNTRHAGEYVFGGADSANPPVTEDLMGSGLAAAIGAAVAGLGGGNAASVLATTKAASQSDAAGTTPFSAYLSDPARGLTEPRRTTVADDGMEIPTGLFANRNAAAASTGETTGSWSRDLLRGLMTLASLDPSQADVGPDLDSLMQGVRAGLRAAAGGLASEEGALGMAENRLEAMRSRHADLAATLQDQLGDIEQVDMVTTLTALQDTKTRLEASWKALSMLSGLSLAGFLR